MRKIQVTVDGISKSIPENLLTKKPNGDFETDYNADMSLDTKTINAKLLAKTIQDGEDLIEAIMARHIKDYNEANGVRFVNVETCFTYSFDLEYEHQPFCNNICAYKISLWKAARVLQEIAIAEQWSAEKFISELPVFKL